MSHSKDDGSNWGGWLNRQSPSKKSNSSGRSDGPSEEPANESSDLNPLFVAAAAVGGAALVVGGARALAKYMGSADDDYYADLSKQIQLFFEAHRQSSETCRRKERLKNDTLSISRTVFPRSKLFIVGSSANGFGLEESDLDLCLVISPQEWRYNGGAREVLMRIEPLLKEEGITRSCTLIPARVPILRFRDAQWGIVCDLNVSNVEGIRNTHLLAMYTRVDPRLSPLGVFVKQWAQRMDIHGGNCGRLSTYALLLMVIQYLQCGCSPPVLPNLQARFAREFDCRRPVEQLDMNLQLPWKQLLSANRSTVGELFAGFVKYYANFDFAHQAISVRNGRPMDVDEVIGLSTFEIFVEEPCGVNNVAHAVSDEEVFDEICEAFSCTVETLRAQKPLRSLWEGKSSMPSTCSTSSRGPSNENKDDGCLLM